MEHARGLAAIADGSDSRHVSRWIFLEKELEALEMSCPETGHVGERPDLKINNHDIGHDSYPPFIAGQ